MNRRTWGGAVLGASIILVFAALSNGQFQDLLAKLGTPQDFTSKRVSSYDRTGGNKDSLTIKSGQTAVLAEVKGPGAIHHIWVTISAEPFYGRKLVLRMYWDGETNPSVEAPIGDFFGVGHGLNRNVASLPITDSSEGRARNCYWSMPFGKSARVTVTNEGAQEVPAFYYYIDYRELPAPAADTPYFHSQYRQEFPPSPGRNYLILEAEGRGHYAGCNLSILQRSMGWWGEGDDMIYVDGESFPSLHGTGSEDYFSDAWGMREWLGLFYGCPLQEEDFQAGAKATVYRFHIPDPIPFRRSIRVTIEHGHANDRADFDSSTAYWYQTEPHSPFPALPPSSARLPWALEPPAEFVLPAWTPRASSKGASYVDSGRQVEFKASKLISTMTSYYGPSGARYPVLATDGATLGSGAELVFPTDIAERYDLDLYLLKGPAMGNFEVIYGITGAGRIKLGPVSFRGYAKEREFAILSLKGLHLEPGLNSLSLQVTGRDAASQGFDIGLIGYRLAPAERKFIADWNLIGPFDAPDMDALMVACPPEHETDLSRKYFGKAGRETSWRKIKADPAGYVRLNNLVQPDEGVVVYALGWVKSTEDMPATLLLGSDDGVRVWVNDELVHTNPAYRASSPDQDRVTVRLNEGWNKVMFKILQGAGGFGFHARFADPDEKLTWSVEPPAK